jgi:dTMP kinase
LQKKSKQSVEYISFPDYKTRIGKEIEAFLSGKRNYNEEARHILYSANRYEHLSQINDWVSKRSIVIINRYCESNIAYGTASGISMEWLRALESRMPQADFVFLLTITPEVSLARKPRRDRFEENAEYLRRVSEVYSALVEPGKWILVNGEKPINEVHREIIQFAEGLIQEDRRNQLQ